MSPAGERRALTIVLAALAIDSVGFGIIMPVMPKMIMALAHVTLPDAARLGGWLLGVFAATQFLFGPVMGGLSDHFGRRPVLLLSMTLFGLDYLVMGFAPTFGWLFASRALAGVAGALFAPVAAYVGDVTPPERRAQSYGLVGAAFGIGFVVGPAVGGLLGQLGPRVPFVAAGVLALLNATVAWFAVPESLPPERRRAFSPARANPFGTFASLGRNRGTLVLLAAWFPWMIAHTVYPSTWAFFAKLKFNWSEGAIGASLAYVGFVMAFAQAVVIRRAIPKLGERRAILLGLALGLVGFVGNGLATTGGMVYAVMTVSMFQGMVFPSMNSLLSRMVSPDQLGELQGGVSSLQSISAIVGPPLMTQSLAFFTGPRSPVFFPGAALVLAGLLTALSMGVVLLSSRRHFVPAAPRT